MRRLWVGALALGLSGCLTWYEEPAVSVPSATIVFTRGDSVGVWGISQALEVVGDERCSSRFRVKEFTPLGDQAPHQFRIAADRPSFFKAVTTKTTGGITGYEDAACSSLVGFQPEVGRRYRIQHIKTAQTCTISITDADTGRQVEGVTEYPYVKACTQ